MDYQTIKIEVNFGNDAMRNIWQAANALIHVAKRMKAGEEPCKVMDRNGNSVGTVEYVETDEEPINGFTN